MVVTSELRLNDVTPLIHATRSPGRVVFLFFFSFRERHKAWIQERPGGGSPAPNVVQKM